MEDIQVGIILTAKVIKFNYFYRGTRYTHQGLEKKTNKSNQTKNEKKK